MGGQGPLFGQPTPSGGLSVGTPARTRTLRISDEIPIEVWNKLRRILLPKLTTSGELPLAIDASFQIDTHSRNGLRQEIEQILRDLNLLDAVKIDLK
jgi:hypothetical protein